MRFFRRIDRAIGKAIEMESILGKRGRPPPATLKMFMDNLRNYTTLAAMLLIAKLCLYSPDRVLHWAGYILIVCIAALGFLVATQTGVLLLSGTLTFTLGMLAPRRAIALSKWLRKEHLFAKPLILIFVVVTLGCLMLVANALFSIAAQTLVTK